MTKKSDLKKKKLFVLDTLSGDKLFNGGVMVKLERELHPELRLNFTNTKPDHHILNTAHHVS
ncbi:MAG: hypothetical protein WBG01_12225 [Bacteroidota bacterium]